MRICFNVRFNMILLLFEFRSKLYGVFAHSFAQAQVPTHAHMHTHTHACTLSYSCLLWMTAFKSIYKCVDTHISLPTFWMLPFAKLNNFGDKDES